MVVVVVVVRPKQPCVVVVVVVVRPKYPCVVVELVVVTGKLVRTCVVVVVVGKNGKLTTLAPAVTLFTSPRRGPVGDSQQKYGKPPADLSKPTVSNNAGEIP